VGTGATPHGVTLGMESNADGNTEVKWKKDELVYSVSVDGLL